jgi:UDPglucose--hexose-1-phosphate uridylyltransferase
VNELRKHYFLERWVVVSSGRAGRPETQEIEEKHIHRATCPFCPRTLDSPVLHHVGDPWRIAVIPNKFPALDTGAQLTERDGLLQRKSGFGYHEVVIDHPEHVPFERFTAEHVAELLGVYAQRTRAHLNDERIEYVSVFRNDGVAAGASIAHPHSQVLALPVVPVQVHRERGKMDEHAHLFGECPFERIYRTEREQGLRILFENRNAYVLAPFASVFPAETWVVPKGHVRTLFELGEDQFRDLAGALLTSVRTLKKLFPGLPYNMAVHQAPRGRDFHLHIEIYPRLTDFGGFELANDTYINVLPPERYANDFREALR